MRGQAEKIFKLNKRIAELEQDCSILASCVCIYSESLDAVSDHDTILCAADKLERLLREKTKENQRLHDVIDRIQGWMEEGHHINLTKQWFDDALTSQWRWKDAAKNSLSMRLTECQAENERLLEENAMLLKNAAKDALLRIEIATTQQAKDSMEGK